MRKWNAMCRKKRSPAFPWLEIAVLVAVGFITWLLFFILDELRK